MKKKSIIKHQITYWLIKHSRIKIFVLTHGHRKWGHQNVPGGTEGSPNLWSRVSKLLPLSWCRGYSPHRSVGRFLIARQNISYPTLTLRAPIPVHLQRVKQLTSFKAVLNVVDLNLGPWHTEDALMLKSCLTKRKV